MVGATAGSKSPPPICDLGAGEDTDGRRASNQVNRRCHLAAGATTMARLISSKKKETGVAAASDPNDLSSLPQVDQDAIAHTLIALLAGFRERDAEQLVGVYTVDADWVNAFGSVKKGGEEIVEYLRGLFANDNFNAGTLKAPPETAMRVLTPDIVLVSAHLRVEGQKLVDGGVMDERDNFSLRVLQRQSDGRWLIVSEMYNDANRESTYLEHS
jgi:uncharacterized protein (TIGR02246 family)